MNKSDVLRVHNPPHVGEVLREMYMEPMKINVTQLAKLLLISRQALSNLVNEKSSISADMAIRLSIIFSTSPEFWMNLAKEYELWHALQNFTLRGDIQPLSNSFTSQIS